MSREGAQALKSTMTIMKLEVPLLTLATEFVNQIKDKSCMEIYTDDLVLSEDQAS